MAAPTKAEVYEMLGATLLKYGYGPGNTPATVDDSTIEKIAALPDSALSDMFSEINRTLIDRWFSNGLNPSTPGLSRFIIRNQGAHGFSITDRFINLISAGSYGTNTAEIASRMFDRASNPIDVKHYTDGYKKPYKTTLDEQSFRKFLTPDGLPQYVAWLESNMMVSAECDMRDEIAAMMKAAVEADQVVTVTGVDMNSENGLADVVEKMMTAVDGFRQPTTLYNVGERKMSTPDGVDVVIVTTPSRWNRVRARLYSDRYHLDQLYVDGQVLFAPEGTDLGTVTVDEGLATEHTEAVQFLVVDARGFCVDVTTMTVKKFDVGSENYINAFLHVEGVKGSVPTFCNAVAFAGEYGNFTKPVEPAPNISAYTWTTGISNYATIKDKEGTGESFVEIQSNGTYAMYGASVAPGSTIDVVSASEALPVYVEFMCTDGMEKETYTDTAADVPIPENCYEIHIYRG